MVPIPGQAPTPSANANLLGLFSNSHTHLHQSRRKTFLALHLPCLLACHSSARLLGKQSHKSQISNTRVNFSIFASRFCPFAFTASSFHFVSARFLTASTHFKGTPLWLFAYILRRQIRFPRGFDFWGFPRLRRYQFPSGLNFCTFLF